MFRIKNTILALIASMGCTSFTLSRIYQKMILKNYLSLFIICITTSLVAQDYLVRDDIYVDNIKGVEFYREGAPLSIPTIDLNGGASIQLQFDDLDNDNKNYIYEIVHCTKDWEISDLQELEYLDGYNQEEIFDSEASIGQYAQYIHYNLNIPNEDTRIKLSGNYLLIIYEDEDDLFPVLTRRFMVVEPLVGLAPFFKRPGDVMKLDSHHEMDIDINLRDLIISDPLNEITVNIFQNKRWDNAIFNLKPRYLYGDILKFNYPDYITFPALKEFRSFDIRTLNTTSIGVHTIDLLNDGTDVLLELQKPRTYENYLFVPDANGGFVIDIINFNSRQNIVNINNSEGLQAELLRSSRINNRNLQAEYANTIFSLETNEYEGSVYVVGKFTDWLPKEEFRMVYDNKRKIYLNQATLKQGYYDYMYVLVNDDGETDITAIEGSWWETENDYTILVYLSEFGANYDRLIGVQTFNSNF